MLRCSDHWCIHHVFKLGSHQWDISICICKVLKSETHGSRYFRQEFAACICYFFLYMYTYDKLLKLGTVRDQQQ